VGLGSHRGTAASAAGSHVECSSAGNAERFIAEVRGDDPEVAAKVRVEERELEGTSRTAAGT